MPTKPCKAGPTPYVQLYFIEYCKVIYKIKTKGKLLHDLCTSSTLFICICETFFILRHKRL